MSQQIFKFISFLYPGSSQLIGKYHLEYYPTPENRNILEACNNDELLAESVVKEIEDCISGSTDDLVPVPSPKRQHQNRSTSSSFILTPQELQRNRKAVRVLAASSPVDLVQYIQDEYHKWFLKETPVMLKLLQSCLDDLGNVYSHLNQLEGLLPKATEAILGHITLEDEGLYSYLLHRFSNRQFRDDVDDENRYISSVLYYAASDRDFLSQIQLFLQDRDNILDLWAPIRDIVSSLQPSQHPLLAKTTEYLTMIQMLKGCLQRVHEMLRAERLILFPLYCGDKVQSEQEVSHSH